MPKSGLHNPLKNVDRYVKWGEISRRAAAELAKPDVREYFTQAVLRTMPKSHAQAQGEVTVTAAFLTNFSGDNVRFMASDFGVSGDRDGQHSRGFRWPYGPVAIVSPFNFPLEIPALQLLGALYMGNKPVIKPASTTSSVVEAFVRLLIHCGMPPGDVDLIHCGGRVMGELIGKAPIRLTQFTGSAGVAEDLARQTAGKVRIEDAGFDWKILGPDVHTCNVEHAAWQSDQDAYAASGQKCSAQSILFMHKNWVAAGFEAKIAKLAGRRSVRDLTIGAVLSESTDRMLTHMAKLLKIPGARLAFGGKPLTGHRIPAAYGAIEPTAVFVPLTEMLKPEHYAACMTEIFGPFQVLTEYDDADVDLVLGACERMSHHLSAGVVTNDVGFRHRILSATVNGVTYAGVRARTSGAPQNHWFGPCGDPRGAGIGTAGAIKMVWSSHREIVDDATPVPSDWKTPPAT